MTTACVLLLSSLYVVPTVAPMATDVNSAVRAKFSSKLVVHLSSYQATAPAHDFIATALSSSTQSAVPTVNPTGMYASSNALPGSTNIVTHLSGLVHMGSVQKNTASVRPSLTQCVLATATPTALGAKWVVKTVEGLL